MVIKKQNKNFFHHKIKLISIISFLCVGTIVGITLGINAYIINHRTKWYLHSNWWDYCSNGLKGQEATVDDIGKLVPLMVNSKIHKIRLIDIDHDNLTSGGKAHCTFEFANLLSDENGYSLTSFWNTSIGAMSESHDFIDSDLRAMIDGQGKGIDRLRWYQKEATTKSTKYTKPVIEMLPNELKKVLKEINKPVAVGPSTLYEIVNYQTRLFPLSVWEMSNYIYNRFIEREGVTYKFYADHNDDYSRIKAQVNENKGSKAEAIELDKNKDGVDWVCFNYAGFNFLKGGLYWTRTPYIEGNYRSWYIDSYGRNSRTDFDVFTFVIGVAPAFCI